MLAALPSIQQRRGLAPAVEANSDDRFSLGAAAVVSVVLVAVALVILRPSQGTIGGPSPAPSLATSAPPPAAVGPLAQSFSSIRHLYTIDYPSGWGVMQGTAPWQPGTRTPGATRPST